MSRCSPLSWLLASSLLGCGAPPPAEPFEYLRVTELSDEQRTALYQEVEPLIRAQLGTDGVMVSEPVAVIPPGSPKATRPGPVEWEIQLPVIDTRSGQAWTARVGADRRTFVLDTQDGAPPLSNEEAGKAMAIADADPRVSDTLAQARAAGYDVEKGAMTLEPSSSCPVRCVDVRYIGFGHGAPGLWPAMSIVFAQVSLASQAVVSTRTFNWQSAPTTEAP